MLRSPGIPGSLAILSDTTRQPRATTDPCWRRRAAREESQMHAPINIVSDTPGLGGALTNPTEIARWKGKIARRYPVEYAGVTYRDAEAAYKANITRRGPTPENMALMVNIMAAKLTQHPILKNAIRDAGGRVWLETCRHVGYGGRWEGVGMASAFIRCLADAYEREP